ncbi:WG repeat-containing protein [Psychrobacter sp. FDAARGOS_221]|uniref:WG repeat-containing protein n=1 Tax=Psychrobacter sp. FDAARGOS_221 TaxID=1975705 RepID=UPI000C9F6973|nr:WG repeat-containing protein [Psychrobacter sp. FDAARGOS_221]PNK60462.1 hypothetical protein A6J60_005950 [Psychrobacter sp. FDAARGOS_221]
MSFTLKKATLALMLASVFSVSALAGNDPDYDEDFEVEEDCNLPDFDRTNTKYILVTCLHNGVSVFGIKDELDNDLFGLINAKGEEVAAPEYRAIRYFSDGLLRIEKGHKEGLITTTGKVVLPTVYDDIGVLHDGYAEILIADSESNNVKKGLVNQKGEVIASPKYDEIFSAVGSDSDVLVVSIKKSEDDIKYGLINLSGQIIVPIIYDKPFYFTDGWSKACKDKHCNFINTKGELLLPYWADDVGIFNESKAWVKQNGRYGYIDESGQIVIPFLYDDTDFFVENGRAIVSYNPENLTQGYGEEIQRDTYGVIDMDNNIIVPFEYQRITRVNPNLLYVQQADDFSFLDNNGNLATTKKFDKIVWRSLFDELFTVKKDGKWGFINRDFETVIPFEYDKAVEFKNDLAAVKKNNKFGFINRDGQTVIPFDYDDANIDIDDWRSKYRFDYDGIVALRKNGYWGVIDKDNTIIVPFIYDDIDIGFDDKNTSLSSVYSIKVSKSSQKFYFDVQGNPIEADDAEFLEPIL